MNLSLVLIACYLEGLNNIMLVADGENAYKILSLNSSQAIEISCEYQRLSSQLNIDLQNIIELFNYIPLFQNGDAHKKSRKRLAASYSASRAQQEKNISAEIDLIGETLRSREGLIDVIDEIARPLWMAVYTSFSQGVELDDYLSEQLPNIFCPNLSIRKRILINEKLAAVLDRNSSLERDVIFEVAALSALGFRPLVYGLALSLHKCCKENTELTMKEMKLPDSYSDTPLRFVDRVISNEFCAENVHFKAGDRIRCQTYSEKYTDDQNAKFLFGTGKHICLGRPISNFIWKNLCIELRKHNKFLLPVCLKLSQREPFVIVESCKVAVKS